MSMQQNERINIPHQRNRSDEFSGKILQPKWQWVPTTMEAVYRMNGVRLQLDAPAYSRQDAQNDLACKMLQDAPEGDWIIDTYLVTVPSGAEGTFCGVIAYVDGANWLAVGRQGEKVIARGVIEGVDTGIIGSADGHKAVRIMKDVKSADHHRYHLYSSEKGTFDCEYLAAFDDWKGLLSKARLGLFSAGGPADFEWFQCFQPEIQADYFSGKNLDGIWQVLNETDCQIDDGLMISSTGAGFGGIIRPALHQDFVIYEKIDQRSPEGQGCLLIWKDKENYLLYGACGVNQTRILLNIDGTEALLYERDDESPAMLYQLEKRNNTYIFRSSRDGFDWQNDFSWQDETLSLAGAWYGLGSRAKEPVRIHIFRELAAPNGKILQTNHHRAIGALFGGAEDNPLNETVTPYAFRTGDLGSLVDAGDEVYMMMGDSFTGYGAGTEGWRSNVLAILEHPTDPEKGIAIKRMILDEEKEAYAKEAIHSEHTYYADFTTIPTGGVKVGDRLYWIYDSISQWCTGAHLDSQYTGWAYSDDGGQTFNRVDRFFLPDEEMVFCFPYQENGYVYLFGSNAKMSGLKLARVQEESVLDRSKYVFWAGNDKNGNPIWVSNCYEGQILFDGFLTEFCVIYNAGLGRYTLGYLDSISRCNVIRDAEHLWGPWSNGVMLVANENIGQSGYMPTTVNRWVSKEGMYYFFTYFKEYVCKWCHVNFVTEE